LKYLYSTFPIHDLNFEVVYTVITHIMTRILYKIIGDKIRQARSDKTLTQEKLAQQIGLTSSSISNIELGTQSVQLHDLYKIAAVLEKDITYLLPTSQDLKEAIPSVDKTIKELPSNERDFVESLRSKVKPNGEA
jgi:transcriptional regulator with XRE-family HTH domain